MTPLGKILLVIGKNPVTVVKVFYSAPDELVGHMQVLSKTEEILWQVVTIKP